MKSASVTTSSERRSRARQAVEGFIAALDRGSLEDLLVHFSDHAIMVADDGVTTHAGRGSLRTHLRNRLPRLRQVAKGAEPRIEFRADEWAVVATGICLLDRHRRLMELTVIIAENGSRWDIIHATWRPQVVERDVAA